MNRSSRTPQLPPAHSPLVPPVHLSSSRSGPLLVPPVHSSGRIAAPDALEAFGLKRPCDVPFLERLDRAIHILFPTRPNPRGH